MLDNQPLQLWLLKRQQLAAVIKACVAHNGLSVVDVISPLNALIGDADVRQDDGQNFIIQHNPTPSKERGGFEPRLIGQ